MQKIAEYFLSSPFSGEERVEASAAEVCATGGVGAVAARGAAQHPQICDSAILEDSAAQREGTQELRHERRAEEGARDSRRAGHCARRVHQRDKPMLSRRSCQVLLAWICTSAPRTRF